MGERGAALVVASWFLLLSISSTAQSALVVENTVVPGVRVHNYVMNPGLEEPVGSHGGSSWEFQYATSLHSEGCYEGTHCMKLASGANAYKHVDVMQFETPQTLKISCRYRVVRTTPGESPLYTPGEAYVSIKKQPGDGEEENVVLEFSDTSGEWAIQTLTLEPNYRVRMLNIYFSLWSNDAYVLVDDMVVEPIFGEGDASKSIFVSGKSSTYPAQSPNAVTVQTYDGSGVRLLEGGSACDVTVTPSGGEAMVASPCVDNEDGTYTATVTSSTTGVHSVAVRINGGVVGDSAFDADFYLMPGTSMLSNGDFSDSLVPWSALGTACVVAAVDGVVQFSAPGEGMNIECRLTQTVTVNQAGAMPLDLRVRSNGAALTGTAPPEGYSLGATILFQDGEELIRWATLNVGAGWHDGSLVLHYDKPILSVTVSLTVQGHGGMVAFDDAELIVGHARMDASTSRCVGSGVWVARVGQSAAFTVDARDSLGNGLRGGVNPDDVLAVSVVRQVLGGAAEESAAEVKAMVSDGKGHYEVSYMPRTHGTHHIHVTVNGEHVDRSPFAVYFAPDSGTSTSAELLDDAGLDAGVHDWSTSGALDTICGAQCRTGCCVRASTGAAVTQQVTLTGTDAHRRVRLSGWSKLESDPATLPAAGDYRLSVDVSYSDGTVASNVGSDFDATAVGEWRYTEVAIDYVEGKTIQLVTVRAALGGAGAETALFDDISLHIAPPQLSLVKSYVTLAGDDEGTINLNQEHTAVIHTLDESGLPMPVTAADLGDLEVNVVLYEALCEDLLGVVDFDVVSGIDGSDLLVRFTPRSPGKYMVTAKRVSDGMHLVGSPASAEGVRANTVDMRVAVFSARATDVGMAMSHHSGDYTVDAIVEVLEGLGIKYNIISVLDYVETNTLPSLVNPDGSGKYYATIYTNPTLVYGLDGAWVPAMTDQIEQEIQAYERNFSVRRVVVSSNPWVPGLGVTAAGEFGITDAFDVTATDALLAAGATHLKQGAMMRVEPTYYTGATINDPSTTQAAALDEFGNVAAVFHTFPDGREQAHTFWTNGLWMEATAGVIPGFVLWAVRGVYTGARRIHLSMQIDDHLMSSPTPQATDGTEGYRCTVSDLQEHIQWQEDLKTRLPPGSDVRLELAMNAAGRSFDLDLPPSERLDVATSGMLNHFYLESHTFTHFSLNEPRSYEDCYNDLKSNKDHLLELCAATPEHCSTRTMVTPMITGLFSKENLEAMWDIGLRGCVNDNTIELLRPKHMLHTTHSNVALNGFDGMRYIPRYASNVHFNTKTDAENFANIDQFLTPAAFAWDSFEGKDFNDVLDYETKSVAFRLALLQHDPYMFHQANLHMYDWLNPETGTTERQSLTTVWAEAVLRKLGRFNNLPITTLKHDDLLDAYVAREARDECGIEGRIVVRDGAVTDVHLSSENTCEAVLTGAVPRFTSGIWREQEHGPDRNLFVKMVGGGGMTIPLQNAIPWGPVAAAVSTANTPALGEVLISGGSSSSSSSSSSGSSSGAGSIIFGAGFASHAITMTIAVVVLSVVQVAIMAAYLGTRKVVAIHRGSAACTAPERNRSESVALRSAEEDSDVNSDASPYGERSHHRIISNSHFEEVDEPLPKSVPLRKATRPSQERFLTDDSCSDVRSISPHVGPMHHPAFNMNSVELEDALSPSMTDQDLPDGGFRPVRLQLARNRSIH